MQQFIKMRKQVSMTESTRLVLNKSIDLLHKLSNGKLSKEEVKKEILVLLSTYFVTVYPDSDRGVDANKKLSLEIFIEQAYGIVDQVDSGEAPLYEAIMLMNKVVVSLKPSERKVKVEKEIYEDEIAEEVEAEEPAAEVKKVHEKVMPEPVRFRPVSSKVEKEMYEDEIAEKEVYQEEMIEERVEESMKRAENYEPRKVERVSGNNKDIAERIGDVLNQKKALEDSIEHLNESLKRIGFELRPIQQ